MPTMYRKAERNEREARLAFEDSYTEPSDVIRIFAACTNGPCDSGRKLCPSPMACGRPEPEPPKSLVQAIVDLLMFWRR